MPYQIKVFYNVKDGANPELNRLFEEGWRPLGGVIFISTRNGVGVKDYITLFKE